MWPVRTPRDPLDEADLPHVEEGQLDGGSGSGSDSGADSDAAAAVSCQSVLLDFHPRSERFRAAAEILRKRHKATGDESVRSWRTARNAWADVQASVLTSPPRDGAVDGAAQTTNNGAPRITRQRSLSISASEASLMYGVELMTGTSQQSSGDAPQNQNTKAEDCADDAPDERPLKRKPRPARKLHAAGCSYTDDDLFLCSWDFNLREWGTAVPQLLPVATDPTLVLADSTDQRGEQHAAHRKARARHHRHGSRRRHRKQEKTEDLSGRDRRVGFHPTVIDYSRDSLVSESNHLLFHCLGFNHIDDELKSHLEKALSFKLAEETSCAVMWKEELETLRREGRLDEDLHTQDTARLELLVSRLADDATTDMEFTQDFLASFRVIVGPLRILSLLLKRFRLSTKDLDLTQEQIQTLDPAVRALRLKVVNVLRKWMQWHPYDFSEERRVMHMLEGIIPEVDLFLGRRWAILLLADIVSYQSELPALTKGLETPVEVLVAAMRRRSDGIPGDVYSNSTAKSPVYSEHAFDGASFASWINERLGTQNSEDVDRLMCRLIDQRHIFCLSSPQQNCLVENEVYAFDTLSGALAPSIQQIRMREPPTFDEIPPIEIARHLCQQCAKIWRPLNLREWASFISGNCELKLPQALALVVALSHFETLSHWVASEIVRLREVADRVKAICKFLQVAELSLELGNFAGAYTVCRGLQHPNVLRLERTWKAMKTNKTKRLKTMSSMLEDHDLVWARACSHDHPSLIPVKCAMHVIDRATDASVDVRILRRPSPQPKGLRATLRLRRSSSAVDMLKIVSPRRTTIYPTGRGVLLGGRRMSLQNIGRDAGDCSEKPDLVRSQRREDIFTTEDGQVNMYALRQLGTVLRHVGANSQTIFRFQIVPSIRMYLEYDRTVFTPTMLLRQSLLCEPSASDTTSDKGVQPTSLARRPGSFIHAGPS